MAIYTFSNFFNKGVSFLLLFYFTQVLTVSDFGMLSLFSNAILFLMPFVSLGIIQSINADFFKLKKNEFRDFFSSTLLLPLLVALAATLLFYMFKGQLQHRYNFPALFIVLIPVITLFSFFNELLTSMVRNNNQPTKYLWISLLRLFAEIILAVFFISFLQYGWMGRVMGILISFIMVGSYAFYYFLKNGYLFGKIKTTYIRQELIYSVPIIMLQLGMVCLSSSAPYFVEFFTHNLSEVGIYSVAGTFASVVNVFCAALLQYLHPKIYSLLSQKEIDAASIRKHFLIYLAIMSMATVAVIIATPFVYHFLLKPSYKPALGYYYFICLGHFFWGISFFFVSFLLYYKLKKKLLLFSISAIIISLTLNAIFTKYLGSYGSALSTAISYLLILGIAFLLVKDQLLPILKRNKSTAQ